jgi:hypothetical protein
MIFMRCRLCLSP